MLIAQPADQEREFEQLLYLARKEIEDGHLDACQLPGGKFFEIIGLDSDVVQKFFPNTRSLVSGRKLVASRPL